MAKITDPRIIQQAESGGGRVTDPRILEQVPKPPMNEEQAALIAQPPAPVDWGRVAETAPQSTASAAEDVLSPIYRTGDFLESTKDLFTGLTDKLSSLIPFEGPETGGKLELSDNAPLKRFLERNPEFARNPERGKQVADAAIEYYKGYADEDTRKRRFEEDPAGVILDAAALVTGGALGATKFGQFSKAAIGGSPREMVKEAVKFPTGVKGLTDADANKLATFMLDNKIPLSSDGMAKTRQIIEETGDAVNQMIDAAGNGVAAKRSDLNQVLEDMKRETLGKSALGEKKRAAIQKVIDGWQEEINKVGKDTMTLRELQDFKQATYGDINWSPAAGVKRNTTNKALKSQALDAKDRIEAVVPEVGEANRMQGNALELAPILDKAVTRTERNSGEARYGFNMLAGGVGGGGLDAGLMAIGLPPGFATLAGVGGGALKGFLGEPKRKTSLAEALYSYQNSKPMMSDDALVKAMLATYPQLAAEQTQ